MSFLKKVWRIPVVALVAALPLVAACADDDGASPLGQDPTPVTGTISGTVTASPGGAPIVGALVGTSPATNTALTDAQGNYVINNVPIPTNPTSYAVTASAAGFQSASATVSLSSTQRTATANLSLTTQTSPVDTTGNLNVLVTDRNGVPQSAAIVTVVSAAGDTVASDTTDATGFALFSDLNNGSYTVTASKTISGIAFRASAGVNVTGGETAFVQLILNRDFGQTVFPNIGGTDVTLDDTADIFFVPVPGSEDDDPTVDCNIIRTQHMFIAEVNDGSGAAVSGVKVQWDLNIAAGGFTPPNTGSVVDSDDPDLNPATARGGLTPAFNVDTRKAITFTNDNDQTVTFNGQSVTVGAGQTWIIITSPVEGITDVIAATPDIPAGDPDCANDSPDACDKEFAIKRWVNWDTSVAELELTPGFVGDPNLDPGASFNFLSEGQTVTNVLSRVDTLCAVGVSPDDPGTGATECELFDDRFLIYAEVARLRLDSPFTLTSGTIELEVTDDTPDIELIGDQVVDCPATDGVQNVECLATTEDEFTVFPGANLAEGEFDAGNAGADLDEIGWVVFELRLDEGEFFCVDVDASGTCDPGNVGSPDTFSTATQRLLAGQSDNTNTLVVRFLDEFGEVCDDFTFNKRFVASRLQVIKSTPDATVRTVTEANGGPDIEPLDTPRPLKTHTIQIGQSFSYTVTAINDGDTRSDNVRITDTLPRFGVQFDDVPPDDGAPIFRNGSQAFAYVTDRPAFDPVAVVYAIDNANDEPGDDIDECVRGDDGTVVGNAYVAPAPCALVLTTDAGTIDSARSEAEDRSAAGDQIVWIQYFDDQILARTDVGGGIQSEDTVEITLVADEDLVGPYPPLPGTWCNISTVTDGPGNLDDTPLTTQSLDADTLCHEVREALLDIRKTAEDAVISAGAQAVFTVEIANNGSATLTNVVINDTLDLVFATSDSLFAEDDIVVDTVAFPGATVVVNPDGRTFTVTIGDLPPTSGFVEVFTVRAITPSTEGVFCNRVTVRGSNPAGTLVETDIACVTTTVTIELDISNEDGSVDAGGVFTSTQEIFLVGGDIVYQVIITNQSANFTATGVVVVDEVAPTTAAIEFRSVRTGFPTQGTVTGTSDAGFTWNIGSLAPGAQAEIQFIAEGVAPQSNVGNRVRLTADQLTGEIVDEEPTTVTQ